MKFVMKVTETLSRTVVVDANDQDDAISKVEQAYDNEDIVLDYKDYDGYDISAVRIACPGGYEVRKEKKCCIPYIQVTRNLMIT